MIDLDAFIQIENEENHFIKTKKLKSDDDTSSILAAAKFNEGEISKESFTRSQKKKTPTQRKETIKDQDVVKEEVITPTLKKRKSKGSTPKETLEDTNELDVQKDHVQVDNHHTDTIDTIDAHADMEYEHLETYTTPHQEDMAPPSPVTSPNDEEIHQTLLLTEENFTNYIPMDEPRMDYTAMRQEIMKMRASNKLLLASIEGMNLNCFFLWTSNALLIRNE